MADRHVKGASPYHCRARTHANDQPGASCSLSTANAPLSPPGGLISYGADYVDHYRQGAGYVDRIAKAISVKPFGAVQIDDQYEDRLGSRAEDEPCPRRRQLSSEAVAGCGRRLHRRPTDNRFCYWRQNLIKLRTLVPASENLHKSRLPRRKKGRRR